MFRQLVGRCLRVVPDPIDAELAACRGLADPKDTPILAAAVREACPWLLSFNGRQFQPGHSAVAAVRPGEFVQHVRAAGAPVARLGGAAQQLQGGTQ